MKISKLIIKAIAESLYYLYKNEMRSIRSIVIRLIEKVEGGELYSVTLRRIYQKYHGIRIGMYSYGGCFSSENIQPGTEIGKYCSFARNVYIYTRNHPIKHKSTHPFFFNSILNIVEKDIIPRSKISIGNDVWIGMNVVILPSVSFIGTGSVIGAGSIVTKDVPPYAIVVGNPARVIRYRFDRTTISQLMMSEWWTEDINVLKNDINNFIKPLE